MKIKAIFGTVVIWVLLISIGLSVSKPVKEMVRHGGPDKVAPDEQPERYPALDLEDLCKQSKNPKCEAIVDSFCMKSCIAKLCAKHGSIRAMCRLMCEAEDLLPQCSQMGTFRGKDRYQKPQSYPVPEQQPYQQGFFPP